MFPGLSGPAPDFRDPLGLLRACHDRVERFADLALRLADHLEAGDTPPDEAVQQSARQVLRYFEEANPQHHADEEEDLLPRLQQRLGARDRAAMEDLLRGLEREHVTLEALWRELRDLLEELAAGRPVSPEAYRAVAAPFREAELGHLTRENQQLLPAAEHHLTGDDLAAMGEAMARRRGAPPPEEEDG